MTFAVVKPEDTHISQGGGPGQPQSENASVPPLRRKRTPIEISPPERACLTLSPVVVMVVVSIFGLMSWASLAYTGSTMLGSSFSAGIMVVFLLSDVIWLFGMTFDCFVDFVFGFLVQSSQKH